jgi:hypothetical protein
MFLGLFVLAAFLPLWAACSAAAAVVLQELPVGPSSSRNTKNKEVTPG